VKVTPAPLLRLLSWGYCTLTFGFTLFTPLAALAAMNDYVLAGTSGGGAAVFFSFACAFGFGWGGWCLANARRYRYCSAMAGAVAVLFPIGTALGAATLWALGRGDTRELFSANQRPGPPAAAGALGFLLFLVATALIVKA
jgi:hypothetical protein